MPLTAPLPRAVALAAALAALGAAPALAHTGAGPTAGFAAGLAHPLGGLDHLLAMLAVGLWAGLRGGDARWAWPLGFVGAMAVGGLLGLGGLGLPLVEPGISASVVALGAAVALALRPPLALGLAVVALAGLAHGHAHGAEAPADGALPYALGFLLATAALHAAGLAAATGLARAGAPALVRAAGAATALGGLALAALA